MNYQNYLSGGSPTYENAMSRPQASAAKAPMSMADFQAYWNMLTPEEQQEFSTQMQGINWGTGGGQGGGIEWGKKGGSGGLQSLIGKFGGGEGG